MSVANKTFVLRDSRSNTGSNISLWKKGGCYTTNLEATDPFTHEQAQRQHTSRCTDIPLPLDELLNRSRARVDCQLLPDPSTTGTSFVLQVSGSTDGNDILFVTDEGSSYDFEQARVFQREQAMEYCTINTNCVCYNRDEITKIVRRTVTLTLAEQDELFDLYGFVRNEPEPTPPKPRYNCCGCGKFISELDYYTSCSHCDAPNY